MVAEFNFIAGDLNYRLNSTFTEYTDKKIDFQKDFKSLDQLHQAMIENKSHNEFIKAHNSKCPTALDYYYSELVNYPGYIEHWNNGQGPDKDFMPTYKQDKSTSNVYIDKKD
jgi:hypothetical protein